MSNIIDKKVLLSDLNVRLQSLEQRLDKDFTGAIQTDIHVIRELKTWIGKVERGEFDTKIWSD